MLIITIDLVPGGYESFRRTIGSMRIANISDLADVSDYKVEVTEGANHLAGTSARNARCTVERHDRRQTIWALLAKAADEATRAKFEDLGSPEKE
ncbi:hypothetical protein [Tardiphaga sp. OK245]|uniref:hypothetical protein n=1 Tax=Tardiphaga sp. OK245 TaxID=1855306 RepID=UPI0008A727A4|nr:hypothetical protein [Tardiphaga sp. OK245]SEI20900.1 hypothetical protein SAMN05216367_5250 [Tardiphaga sp. OK245]